MLQLIALLTFISFSPISHAQNLLQNPGFEEGMSAPANWNLGMEGRGAGSATWDSVAARNGKYCARIELLEPGDYWMAQQSTAPASVLPEHNYRISGWYKSTGGARPCVYFRDAVGAFINAWETGLPATETWRSFSFIFKTPVRTDHFELQLRTAGVAGLNYWDDIALEDAQVLLDNSEALVTPLLDIAAKHPAYLWAIVSDGGNAVFKFAGAPELEVAWATTNVKADDETHFYGADVVFEYADRPALRQPLLEGPVSDQLQEFVIPAAEARTTQLEFSTLNTGPGPITLIGVKNTDAVRQSLAEFYAGPLGITGTVSNAFSTEDIAWQSHILPQSVNIAAQITAQNHNDVLRVMLGAAPGRPVAYLLDGWKNFTEAQWRQWAALKSDANPQIVDSGMRGEALSAQVLYTPPGSPKTLTATMSDLQGAEGAVIPKSACQVRLVDYVELNKTWYPDPLLEQQSFKFPAHGPAVFWLTVKVPEDAKPGIYSGTATLQADGGSTVTCPYKINVWDITLPKTPRLHTSFWLSRGQLNQYFDIPAGVTIKEYAPWVNLALEHRLSPIDFHEGPSTLLVDFYREADGSFSYDFTRWDEYLDLMKAGNANTIHIALTHWIGRYFSGDTPQITDRTTGEKVSSGYEFLSKEHLDALGDYLNAAAKHVREKGFDFVYVQPWDEPGGEGLEHSYQVLKGLKERVPDVPRLMTAVAPETHGGKMDEVVNLWCPLSPWLEGNAYDKAVERGDILWWYVCCGPGKPYANLFTNWTTAEMRVLFWQSYQYEVTGLLYWSMNYWINFGAPMPPVAQRYPKGPWISSTGWGDGYFMYPTENVDKPLSSIRLETIRDGMEDFDLLSLLGDAVKANPDASPELLLKAQKLLQVPAEVSENLQKFDRKGDAIEATREQVAEVLMQLQATGK